MALVARNGLWITRAGAQVADPYSLAFSPLAPTPPTPLTYDGMVQAIASGEMRLAAGSNILLYSASSNVQIGAQGVANVFTISSNAVTVEGDLRVRGVVDALSTSELHVSDKVVRLAIPTPQSAIVAEADLSGAGVAIAPGAYAKSLLWNVGSEGGRAAAMLSNDASYWELSGGALRVTLPTRADAAKAAAGGAVSYALRINAQEQLEIVKFWTDATGGPLKRQRVFSAGATASNAALPTSASWFP